jgi:hypothetical protein
MRKLFLHLAAVVLVFSACQKELSKEDLNATPGSGGGGGNPGNRLVRTGTRLGTDSVTIDYSYNSASYLTGISISGTTQGQPFTMQQRVNRNVANVITSVVVKSPLLPLFNFGGDSLVREVVYNATTGRYVRSISNFIYDNEPLTDSTVFTYSSVGKLSSAIAFFSDNSSDFFPLLKTEYTFAENNLSETKFYEFSGNDFELEEVTSFSHDNKVNPLPVPSEAQFLVFSNIYSLPLSFWFQIGLNDFFSVNNITNMRVEVMSTSEAEETASAYTYNSRNLPETCTRTIDGIPFAVTRYFYQ